MNEESRSQPVVGILLGGDVFEDWLEELGISVDAFCHQMMGSWVFNYIQALQTVGVRPILFCVAMQVRVPTRLTHGPTGATILLLPPPKIYQIAKRWLPKERHRIAGHGWRAVSSGLFEQVRKRMLTLLQWYLSTPLIVLFRELRREGCRSLLVQEYESVRFDICVLMGRLMRVRVVGTFTGGYPQRGLLRPLRAVALRLCDGLVICAQSEANRVVTEYAFPPSKLVHLHYPLDFSVWYPENKDSARTALGISQDAQVVIYHGETLLWVKGLDVLLNAWERIYQDRPNRNLVLVVLGTGPDAMQLSRMLATKRQRGVYWLNQWIHDRGLIRRYLSVADVYVFPSRCDAFPVSIIEAMACGLPVVASNVRGIPDMFPAAEQSGGILVPPGDVDALVRETGRVLDDRALAETLGRCARGHAEATFSMQGIGQQLRALLLNGSR